MKIDGIQSMRDHRGMTYSDIVYEWEEDLSKALGVPLRGWTARHRILSSICSRVPCGNMVKRLAFGKKRYLRFVMNAMDSTPLFNTPAYVPVIIDFFVSDDRIPVFISYYDQCEYVLVTSRQAFDKLSQYKLPFRIAHLPLTLSDRYRNTGDAVPEKKYPLTLLGAQSLDTTLRGYADRYAKEHPGFFYVVKEDQGNRYYTNTGEFIADAATRDDYLALLRATKVMLYSTPGIRGRRDACGYDQVTPKFLEAVNSYCQVIPRYTDNSDTRYFGLPQLGPSADSYAVFERMLTHYLSHDVDAAECRRYMEGHFTSSLADMIRRL